MFETQRPKRKEYSRISYQTRRQLIRLVVEERKSIKEACERLRVNYSTGKLTVNKYQREGRITRFSDEVGEPREKDTKEVKQKSQCQNIFGSNQSEKVKNITDHYPAYMEIQQLNLLGCDLYQRMMQFQTYGWTEGSNLAVGDFLVVCWVGGFSN